MSGRTMIASEDAKCFSRYDAGRDSRSGPRHVGTSAAAAVMGAGLAICPEFYITITDAQLQSVVH